MALDLGQLQIDILLAVQDDKEATKKVKRVFKEIEKQQLQHEKEKSRLARTALNARLKEHRDSVKERQKILRHWQKLRQKAIDNITKMDKRSAAQTAREYADSIKKRQRMEAHWTKLKMRALKDIEDQDQRSRRIQDREQAKSVKKRITRLELLTKAAQITFGPLSGVASRIQNVSAVSKKLDGDLSSLLPVISGITKQLTRLASVASVVGGAFLALQGIVSMLAQQYNRFEKRISTVTETEAAFIRVTERLKDVAIESGTSLDQIASMFQKISRTADGVGATEKQIVRITEAITKLGKFSGASVEQTRQALSQLSQIFAKPQVELEDFKSIMDNMPALANEIAEGMGVTRSELLKMVDAGEVANKEVFGAILKQVREINEEFDESEKLLSTKFQGLQTSLNSLVGTIDELAGSTSTTNSFLQLLTNTVVALDDFLGGAAKGPLPLEVPVDSIKGARKEIERLERAKRKFKGFLGSEELGLPSRSAVEKRIEELSEKIKELEKKNKDMEGSADSASDALSNYGEAAKDAVKGFRDLQREVGSAQRRLDAFTRGGERALQGVEREQLHDKFRRQALARVRELEAEGQLQSTLARLSLDSRKDFITSFRQASMREKTAGLKIEARAAAGEAARRGAVENIKERVALQKARDEALSAATKAAKERVPENIEKRNDKLEKMRDLLDKIGKTGEETFGDKLIKATDEWASTFSSQLADIVTGAENSFRAIARSFNRMILETTLRNQVATPLSQAIGSGIQSFMQTTPPEPTEAGGVGAALGGTLGELGAGAFKSSSSRGSGSVNQNINIDARGADQAAVMRIEKGLAQLDRSIEPRSVAAMREQSSRGGRIN